MSRTYKTIKSGKPKGRGNPLGLCMCVQCKTARLGKKDGDVMKMKKKFRNSWKTGKHEQKGVYSD
jgi:hypothetical protein